MNKIDSKAIEEMAKIIDQAQKQGYQRIFEETRKFVQENHRYSSKNDYDKAHRQTIDEIIAEALYNAGYTRKIKDDEFVLSISEVEEFRKDQAEVKFLKKQIQEETRKETAREILQELQNRARKEKEEIDIGAVFFEDIEELAEKYGVEVE